MTEKRGTVRPRASDPVTLKAAEEALAAAWRGDLDTHRLATSDPTQSLLRLCVNYRPRDARTKAVEPGIITAVTDKMVLVRYWGEHNSKPTTPECLTWAYPS